MIAPIIIDLGEDSKRTRRKSTDTKYEEDDLAGSLDARHGVGVDGVTDGQVPLAGEGEDGQDGAVLGHLGYKCSDLARAFTKLPRILMPVDGQIKSQS